MKKFKLIFVVAALFLITGCEASDGSSADSKSVIHSFSVDKTAVSVGDSFTINSDVSIAFDMNIYIQLADESLAEQSIYYITMIAKYERSILYEYESGKITSLVPLASSYDVEQGKTYNIWVKSCNMNLTGSNDCVVSAKHSIKFN